MERSVNSYLEISLFEVKKIRNTTGILVLSGIISACGLLEEITPENNSATSMIELTGAETGTLEFDEVNFTYTIFNQPGTQESSIHILVGSIDNSSSTLQLSLTESGNGTGFSVGEVYFNKSNHLTTVYFTPIYASGTTVYTLNPVGSETNSIVFTLIRENMVEASFEVNLESVRGDKISLSGSFIAEGETIIN